MRRRVEIDQQHGDGPVALGLQLKAALTLQRRTQERGQRRGFRHQLRHRRRIVVALEQLVDRRSKPHQAPARRQGFDGEGQDDVVDDLGRGCALEHGHGLRSQTPREHALLRVQAVFRFVEHDRLGPVDHLVGHLLAAMGGQAMHEDRVRRGVAHELGVDLIGREQIVAPALVLVAHRHPAVRDDRRRVLRRRHRIDADGDVRARLARAPRAAACGGCNSGGQAISSRKSNRAEASIQDDSTLL